MNLKDELLELNKKFKQEELESAQEKFREISLRLKSAAANGQKFLMVQREEVNNILWDLLEQEGLQLSSFNDRNETMVEIKWG